MCLNSFQPFFLEEVFSGEVQSCTCFKDAVQGMYLVGHETERNSYFVFPLVI